jgi:transcriptional regulator with XRE-family HTH domain
VVDAATMLRSARREAGLTQRELARQVGMPQPTVARIEARTVVPRIDTLDALLAVCGKQLELRPRPGTGVDRGPIRALLALTPGQRLRLAAHEARNLDQLLMATRSR